MIDHGSHKAGNTELYHMALEPARSGQVAAFVALSGGDDKARVFLNAAADPKMVSPNNNFSAERVVPIRGGGGLYAAGTLKNPILNHVTLRYGEADMAVPLVDARLNILAGKDCVLSTINHALSVKAKTGEKIPNPMAEPSYIHDWLSHHAAVQGLTGAMFLNRLGPKGEGEKFTKRLKRALKADPIKGLERVVILDIPGPTGKVDHSDERHLINAPDAPGKSRMDPPPADPWRAVFGDEILLEFARYAFFARATGVAYLDLSDWLSPAKSGQSVFDDARAARPDPLITLTGLNAFAWKLPNNGKASPGDHICRPFDLKASFLRWVFCPVQARNAPHVWRPHRIIGLEAQEAPEQRLWRMSALRHPGAAPAQIVPKSALQEDPELLDLSTSSFGHKPFRVPLPDIENKAVKIPAAQRGKKIVLVTAMKNEGPFLLEWIAYNRAIGVSDIIVFTNDCTDGTDTFLDLLAERGIVEHYENPFREVGLKPQHAGFRAAEEMDTVKNADWLMTLDVDEFLNVHVGDGHLSDLFEAVGQANLISCTWRLFGNSDLAPYEDDFLLRQFSRCAATSASRPHQAWGFKTLYQNNGFFRKLGVHRPKGLKGSAVQHLDWINGSGQKMPEKEYRAGWRSSVDTVGYDLVSLNHYAVRSVESFLVKRDRGRVNHVERDQGDAYWFRMNHNTTEETSIQRMIPALQAEWDRLMADPEIAAAHEGCVAAHRAKIKELRAQPEQEAFYEALSSDRYCALSKLLPHFGANVFLAGPGSVPQDLVDKFSKESPPDDFFFTVERTSETKH